MTMKKNKTAHIHIRIDKDKKDILQKKFKNISDFIRNLLEKYV
jgi:hypothetical protein